MGFSAERGPTPVVPMRVHRRLTPAVPGDVLVSVSVGPSAEAVALWASPADQQAMLARNGADRSSPGRPVAVRLTTHDAGADAVVSVAALGMEFSQVQPLPAGQILVVAARGGTAVVFDADGEPVRRGDLGDGIEHVMTTPTGQVWVGYFDEGAYGDDPVAHHGIVRFTEGLDPDWMYPYDSGFGPVDDCYTLNVDGETAWSCYYNNFPIVRISGGVVTGWRNHVKGATALIVGADACALVGGYNQADHRVVVGRLGDGQFEPTGGRLLAIPDGRRVPPGSRAIGRGPDLHLFVDTTWYRLGLDDLT